MRADRAAIWSPVVTKSKTVLPQAYLVALPKADEIEHLIERARVYWANGRANWANSKGNELR